MSTPEPWLVRIRTAVVAVTALLVAIAPEPAIGQSSRASETLVIFVRHAEAGEQHVQQKDDRQDHVDLTQPANPPIQAAHD